MSQKNWYPFYELTGGGVGSLDSQDGINLQNEDKAIVLTEDCAYFYTLDEDSGLSENSPDVISPDSNYNLKRWILVGRTILSPEFSRILAARFITVTGVVRDGGFLGGYSHTMNNEIDRSLILGGNNHVMKDDVENCLILGGNYNTMEDDVFNSVLLGGHSDFMDNDIESCVMLASQASEILNNAIMCVLLGGSHNSMDLNIDRSAIIGGQYNTQNSTIDDCGILGGYYNKMNQDILHSIILGGWQHLLDYDVQGGGILGGWYHSMGRACHCSVFLGGYYHAMRSNSHKSGIIGGYSHALIEGVHTVIIGGDSNSINEAENSVILGGYRSRVKKSNDAFVFGSENIMGHADNIFTFGKAAFANIEGQKAYANGRFNITGDAQVSDFILNVESTDAIETAVPINATYDFIPIMTEKTCRFDIFSTARQVGGVAGDIGDSAIWKISGAIRNIGSSLAKGTVTFTGIPVNGQSITIGTNVYTFSSDPNYTLNHIHVGTDAADAATNLAFALRQDPNIMDVEVSGATIVLSVFPNLGSDGNTLVFTTNASNVSIDGGGTFGGTTAWAPGTISFVGTPQNTGVPNVYDCDVVAQAWEVNVEIDDVNKGLKILVTGEADKTIHWNNRVSFVEVG